jgi:hypothetical protein
MRASKQAPQKGPRSFGREALEAIKVEILSESSRDAVTAEDQAFHRANKRAARIIDRYLSGVTKEVISNGGEAAQ